MPTREQMIRELMIKDLEDQDAQTAPDNSKDSWLRTKVPLIGTDLGESIVRPTLQGLGAVGGIVAGAPAGPLGSIAGAGAGYAGAEQLYKAMGGAPVGSLSEELVSAAKNVIEGATMEAGGQVLPAAFSAIRKTPQLVKSGINALRAEAPATGQGIIREVRTGKDVLRELSEVAPTPETIAANERFKAMGLEELTPAQLQSKIKGEPTPAQTAEAMIKSRDPKLYEQGQKQITSAENILNKYRELGSSSKEVAGQQIKEGLKKAVKPYGEQIGKFKEAGADVPLQEIIKKPIPPMSKLPEEGQFPAIKTDDGSIFFEPNNGIHLDIIEKQGIPPERIKSGGFLKDGVYEPSSRSSTEALAEQARAKERISIKRKQFTKPKLPISELDEFEQGTKFKELLNINALYNKAKNVRELDAISSNISQQINEAKMTGSSKYARKLSDIKNTIEDAIASKLEQSGFEKPKEAYTVYAQVKQLEDDVLKGINKVGGAKTVINRVTSSNESIDKFRKTAQALQAPELMTTVKENWLADLLSDPKFKSKWEKVKREGIAQNLLDPEQFKKLDIIISEYLPKAESTLVKTVNPSRSGFVSDLRKFGKNPKEFVVEFILGDERKYKKAIKKYKKVLESKPGLDNGEPSGLSQATRRSVPYILGRENK